MLLENPSTYVAFRESTMSETDFIRAVARRTGCGLLLDINNVFVSATNHGFSPLEYLADFPWSLSARSILPVMPSRVDDEGDPLLIDSHDRPVADAVWKLYEIVVGACGPVPTLVEWDSEIPEWPRPRSGSRRRAGYPRLRPRRRAGNAMRPDLERTALPMRPHFAAALLDPDRETPALVAGPAGKAAAKRYNVYRNNVTVSLIDALAAVYPAVQRITGVDFFRAMARFHIRATPPTSPLLFEYGRDFPPSSSDTNMRGHAVACRHGAHRARLARRLSRRGRSAADGRRSGCLPARASRGPRVHAASGDSDRAIALSPP